MSNQLEKAIRAAAQEPREASELALVLARLVAGKTQNALHKIATLQNLIERLQDNFER